jgi:hypothetical protein
MNELFYRNENVEEIMYCLSFVEALNYLENRN